MDAYEMSELIQARRQSRARYREFLRVPSLSAGTYELPRDGRDLQVPHAEDEIYYVVEGRATMRVGTEDREVKPGSVVFVPARTEHRFHRIREDLSLLVVFAPAEGSRGDGAVRSAL